ncbi:MAG: ATP-binding protein [Calditrichaeota bacterium]|nr:MAG: ATP-binding protein [Calditrichota bacterium]
MYVPRTLEHSVLEATRHFPVVLLTGARQVGKTTLLQNLKEAHRTYVTLDDPLLQSLAQEDPALFMQRFPPPVFIDEIQYAPQLLPYIKMAVDAQRRNGLFWLTGSQQFHLMKNVSESLAGRVAVLELYPFSRQELSGKAKELPPFLPAVEHLQKRSQHLEPLNLKALYRHIWRGSFPAIALSETMDRDLFYGSYVQTYLQRDVRAFLKVYEELQFLRFLRAAAARTGSLLNIAELARDADISHGAAKNWLAVLQATHIVFLLEPYFPNITKRMVKAPKLYFTDTGLCSYLTEWSSPETLEAGAMSGAILETWVINEIFKSYRHRGKRPPLYYYRDRDKREIDLLIVEDHTIYPLEIKKTASPTGRMVRHFEILERLKLPVGQGGVICLTDRLLPLTQSYSAIPVWML